MNKSLPVMNRFFIIVFFICLLTGCGKSKLLVKSNSLPYLNYDKIRISLTINDSKHRFKGYIQTIKDTSVCFRFWGPLGYELGNGLIDSKFVYHDALNNLNYKDLKQKMEDATGLVLCKQVILDILTGSVERLASELVKLNGGIISVVSNNSQYLEIQHNVSHQRMIFKYKFENGFPRMINIKSKGSDNIFEIKLEIVEISHEKKICRFQE